MMKNSFMSNFKILAHQLIGYHTVSHNK